MIARRLRPLLGLWFALVATQAWPAPAALPKVDLSRPIAVNADSFLADLNGETGVYTGNVIVTQGAIRLHADRVKISAPGGKASRVEADGHVVVDSPSGQAVGDSGDFEVAEQLLHLKGNVVLTKDANVMRGSALEVSMATGTVRLTAAGPQGRVQGLFVPNQGGNSAATAANGAPQDRANPPKP